MKKLVLFLSIIMFAFTGFVFACNNDKYADLNISVSSVVSQTSGNTVNFNAKENCYEVTLGETFVIDASVSCSSDISKTLIFNSESSESLNHIKGLDSDTDNGTKATFKASAPSYDTLFKVKISSYEASNKSKTVFVKVILPLKSIALKQNLGLTQGNDINLNEQVIYTSAIPSQYETNEKGANFVLKSFKSNAENSVVVDLEDDGNGNYYFKADENKKVVFAVNNGIVSVKDNSLEGTLNVEAKSIKFNNSLEELENKANNEEVELTEEQISQIENNNKFKAQTGIRVIKGISVQDFTFEGGQIGFVSNAQGVSSKLNASLYINSLDTYKLKNGKTYSYNYEKIDFNIATSQKVSVQVVESSKVVGDEVITSDKDAISNANLGNVALTPVGTSGYKGVVQFNAGNSNGNAYFDFVVTFTEFENKIEYKFSELYSQLLESLSDEQLANVDTENNVLTFNCSALASSIAVYQDNNQVQTGNNSLIRIYDSYKDSNNISQYGTKINTRLTLSSGLTSFNINEQNREVKVYVKHSTVSNVNINNYIEIRGANYNRITLTQEKEVGPYQNLYYFELNLKNENTSYFYAKASSANLTANALFNFEFVNILKSSISTFSGEEVIPNTTTGDTTTTLKNLTAFVNAKTVKGVNNVLGVIKNGEDFYEVDSNHLTSNALYQKLILKLHSTESVTEKSGAILGIAVNEYVDENLSISAVNSDIVKIFELNSSQAFDSYVEDYNEENEETKIQFNKAYSIAGLKLGSTTLQVKSENGYVTIIEVEVVNSIDDIEKSFSIEAKQGYSKVVYQNELNEASKYLSARINGKFSLAWNTIPDKTGIVNVSYNVYKVGTTDRSNALVIDNKTGLVETREVGKADIYVNVSYYVFDNTNGYYEWTVDESFSLKFTFEVFEPATMYRLTNNGISNVYSYDSLGYEYKQQSIVNIGVIISPSNATINANKGDAVSYVVNSTTKNLRGSNGVYTAYLKEGQTRATEYVTVYITEYGFTTTLVYTVNIFKAPQIELIESAIFEGEVEKEQKLFAVEDNGNQVEYISTTNNKELTFNTTISPANVYIDDLFVKIFKAQDNSSHGFTTNEFSDDDSFATLNYAGQTAQSITLNNGRDSFVVKTSNTKTGFFYVVIFAKDSMTSKNAGSVYKKYVIEITDGSLKYPYVIENARDLINISNNPSKHYVLGSNINLSFMSSWTPISNFTGSLNGFNSNIKQDENSNGTFYKITGLKIASLGTGFVGLFEKILVDATTSSAGSVMNLAVEVESINLTNKYIQNTFIDNEVAIGVIAGVNEGIISNCSVNFKDISVSIKNKAAAVGGVVGINRGGIFNFPNEVGLSSKNYGSAISDFEIIDKSFIETYSAKNYVLKKEFIDNTFVSSNPVNGNLYVSDNAEDPNNFLVYAGGMVGRNFGTINGIYGVYNYIEEENLRSLAGGASVNYLTSYQSQGVDVKVNINHRDSGYAISNNNSIVGGVVGYNENAKILNTSVEAVIGYNIGDEIKGVKDYVGGVVGRCDISVPEASDEINTLYNLMVNAKIRANDYVGGIVGHATSSKIELVRVENYENINSNEKYSQTMILANNQIGGIAGYISDTKISTAYSYSFVNMFNQALIENPDIVSLSTSESNVGGIVGSQEDKIQISAVYSTFGLKSLSPYANVAGIIGLNSNRVVSELTISNVYYVGVINSQKQVNSSNALVNVDEGDQQINGYYFYYVLDYVDSQDIAAGTNFDSIVCVTSMGGIDSTLENQDVIDTSKINSDFFSDDSVYSFTISEDINKDNILTDDELVEISTKVITYLNVDGNEFNFIRSIPESITVNANNNFANEIVDFKLDLSQDVAKYFYYYVDENGYTHLVARYSELNNSFNLNDIFNVVPNPNTLGRINILVNAEQTQNVISISDDGKLIINKVGSSVLKFTIRENVSTPTYVYVDVVKSFDELLLSNLTNFKTTIINTEDNPINVRKLTDINIYSLFGEYINEADASGKIVYKTINQDGKVLCLVQIEGAGFYSLVFDIKYKDDAGTYSYDASMYEVDNNTIRFIKEGLYKVEVSVVFSLNEQDYLFTNSEWISYYNIYTGATAINFDTKSFGLTGNNVKTDLKLTVVTDEANIDANNICVYLVTDNTNEPFEFVYDDFDDVWKFEKVNNDNILNLSLTSILSQGNSHTFTFNVSIDPNYRYLNRIRTFTLYAHDVSIDKLGNKTSVFQYTPASVIITLNPKGVSGLTTIHYAYTQQTSQLENNANTNNILGNNKANFSYSFTNEPKNSVVAGNEGLFVVDVTPYYSNITSVSIESSLSSESGNTLQFVQLVKIKTNSNDEYYIYAPQTKALENGNGIYLNKFSYIPKSIAQLAVSNGNYQVNILENEMIYGFGRNFYTKSGQMVDFVDTDLDDRYEDNLNNSEVGRLYIKTVAPSNLKVEESFEVYVKVTYKALDENGVLTEYEDTYTHKLFVESMPGLRLSVNHDGNERSVIAYTGETVTGGRGVDYLDIVPIVDEGYTYKSITGGLYQTSNPDKKIEGPGTSRTEDFTLTDLSNGKGKRLQLGTNARIGDTIIIKVVVSLNYEGYEEERQFSQTIRVVDVVIEDITIKDLDATKTLKITVSTSKQLKVVIDGYGTKEALADAENAISRSVSLENDINYWFAFSPKSDEYYVNLDKVRNLPFNVQKISITNEQNIVEVSSNSIGAGNNATVERIETIPKLIVLEGSTSAGVVDMQLKFSYVYLDREFRENDTTINAGSIVFVPYGYDTEFEQEKFFTVQVTEDSNEDNPTPIYDAEKFYEYLSSTTGGDFILMNDITLSQHTAINAKFGSLDGNNKIITIDSFAYNPNLVSSSNTNYSINMGLFDTVSQDTIIKNVIVALPNNKKEPMNLKGYSTINFGGIAAVNYGMITNCDVITVTEQQNATLTTYNEYDYTLNIETATLINGNDVVVNIGLLVGKNESTGFVTNSRVGREEVDVLTVYDSEATVVYKNKYANTAPITLVKVYGRANVGGFTAINAGTISSSYVKNIQLEVNSVSSKDFVKTAGFVVTNQGFVYGSYVAGWEEEGIKNSIPNNRKLGGGLYSNGFIGGFVYRNESYIEDCYSNVNLSGDLTYAAQTSYIKYITIGQDENEQVKWISPAVGGFVYTSTEGSLITTSYSLSKIATDQDLGSARSNTHGAFEGRMESADSNFINEGIITNSYFMLEKNETFSYEHEQAIKLTDEPTIDLESNEETTGVNEFISEGSFNSFSFDNNIEDFNGYEGTSTGGVWAIYKNGDFGYPELISANNIAISSRVINVTKTNSSETNKFYYTYVDGYDIGSTTNPYLVSNFDQYNNIFKDAIGQDSFNDNVTTKFTGNIRLIRNINFNNSEEVYSTTIEYTSLINSTSIFDGNYLAMYNITLASKSDERPAFGLFKDIYYAGVKNLTLAVDRVTAGNAVSVGALAGVIVNSNISNVTLVASTAENGVVLGKNYVGALAGIIVSSDKESLFTISNIKSNLSIVGNVSTPTGNEVNAITTSSVIWERIKPTATSSGLSELNANLRLHKLPNNVNYAGGIAGVIDLHQIIEIEDNFELNVANAYNIHVGTFDANTILGSDSVNYDKKVSIVSDYSGGLFGLIGAQTYLEAAEFVAQQESEDHYISAREIAGGIAAVNFGKISQSYLSFSKQQVIDLDTAVINYVSINTQDNLHNNTTLFAFGSPKYVGGIAGINIGNGDFGSGNIIDSYSRVDIKNASAIGVGGIAGGAYIGQISNVYSTSSLMGDLSKPSVTKIGAIIGKIFEDGNEGYFADYHGSIDSDADNLALSNIVAVNLWDTNDFATLYNYAKNGGKIGALYGEYKNEKQGDGTEESRFIKLTQGVYVQNYALRDFTSSEISKEDFKIENLAKDTYIELWGVSLIEGSSNYNDFLSSHLIQGQGADNENLIFPNDMRALFSSANSTLRETYFPASRWSRVIWNYDRHWDDDTTKVKLLPVLEYGYESSVIRIYTANQFFQKLNSGSSAGKLYVIMNDIDFSGIEIKPISLTFRGHLFGNNVVYKDETGTEYSRKPILFNLNFENIAEDDGKMTTSISSIFQNTIGATFSNFNVVLSSYNVTFAQQIETETIASVMVGNAINTTVNNVHIYSSLTDKVNKEIALEGYTYYSDEIRNQVVTVSQGYALESKQIVRYSSFSYLKLATPISTIETSVEDFNTSEQWYLKNSSSEKNTFRLFRYNNIREEISYGIVDIEKSEELSKYKDFNIVTSEATVNTNATIVGLLMGVSSLSYVTNTSVNIDLNINYDYAPNNSIYVGSMIGRNIGELHTVVSTSNITLKACSDKDADGDGKNDKLSLKGIYVGGFVGSDQGVVRFAYIKNTSINIGDNINSIDTSSGGEGTFIGGMIGCIDRYTTINEAVVGGANFLYAYDCEINAYVIGSSNIGGIIGKNGFTLGDVYYKQTYQLEEGTNKKIQKSINVFISNENSSSMVGGIVALNNSTTITGVYTNASVIVKASEYKDIKLGGIIAYTENEIKLTNAVNDAEKVEFINTSNGENLGSISIGGLVGDLVGSSSGISLLNVFSAVDIISTQEDIMNIGGMIGAVDGDLYISNGVQLGDIYLGRSAGVKGKDNAFFESAHRVGGMVGSIDNDIIQDIDAVGFIVLSTIRDYALAQKTDLEIGPIFGTNGKNKGGELELFFNENISLVSDNGYNSISQNIAQSSDKENSMLYQTYNLIYNGLPLKVDTKKQNLYSKYLDKYFEINIEEPENSDFYIGSKMLPDVYTKNKQLVDYKYYVLNSDIEITTSINTTTEGWVINAQGYTIKGAYPVFNTITENSAVVGLMENEGNFSINASGVVVRDNYGFIFSCGVSSGINTIIIEDPNKEPENIIKGSGYAVASFAFSNYGVISTSFSIANIKTTSSTTGAAGLVVYNGNTEKEPDLAGNIYCSYYTGTLTPNNPSTMTFAGLALNSNSGFISNSYTMGDIDISTVSSLKDKIHPIASTNSPRLYKTFYDYVAYTGREKDVDGSGNVIAEVVDVATAKKTNYITQKGIYVWSSSLTGGDNSDKNYDSDVANVLGGNWLKPGIVDQLVELFKGSFLYNLDVEVKIDTSWFNYGYTTNNFVNIIVGGQDENDNVIKYLTMLYTGNGLASKEMAGDKNTKNYTNGFLDYPYMVKHAGILDVLVSSNNISSGVEFKYYLITKNIDFIKYTGKTYWSQAWDDNKVVFYGDLDGNLKTIMNMYSSYGLLRAMPISPSTNERDNGKFTSVRDLTIINSYSKTGLIAGYAVDGNIIGVKLDSNLVYNGNFDSFGKDNKSKYLGREVYFENDATANFAKKTYGEVLFKTGNQNSNINKTVDGKKANFAGLVVGYMNGGVIANNCNFLNSYVLSSNQDSDNSSNYTVSYTGGITGIFVDGNIGGYGVDPNNARKVKESTTTWTVGGIKVSSVNKTLESANSINIETSYVGGIAGYLGNFSSDNIAVISYIKTTSVYAKGSYSVGGFAGVIDGGEINNCDNATTNPLVATNTRVDVLTTDTLGFKVSDVNEKVSYAYYGGIAGRVIKGNIKQVKVSKGINVNNGLTFNSEVKDSLISAGGIAGILEGGNSVVDNCTLDSNCAVSISDKKGSVNVVTAGIVGVVNNGSKVKNSTNLGNIDSAQKSTISGGIVGKVTDGEISSCFSGKDSSATQIASSYYAGGIAGYVFAEDEDRVTITDSQFFGTISAKEVAGGIAGYVYANSSNNTETLVKIDNCSTKKDNSSNIGQSTKVAGGIVGVAYNKTTNSENIKLISNTNNTNVQTSGQEKENVAGGIVAAAKNISLSSRSVGGSIKHNKNTGTISNSYVAGGIAGVVIGGTIENAINTSTEISAKAVVGGLVAIADSEVKLSGEIQNGASGSQVVKSTGGGIAGGIVGVLNRAEIQLNSKMYNVAHIGSSNTAVAGGLIGFIVGDINQNKENILTSSYSNSENTGNITATSTSVLGQDAYSVYVFDNNGVFGVPAKNTNKYNITVTANSGVAGGIIGATNKAVKITGVQTSGGTINSSGYAGGIIGRVHSGDVIISKASNGLTVNATSHAGGIIATADSSIYIIATKTTDFEAISSEFGFGDVTNTGSVTAEIAGGIVGYNNGSSIGKQGGTIKNTAAIKSTSLSTTSTGAGGIVGWLSSGQIDNSTNAGSVNATSGSNAGGLVGLLSGSGSISDSNSVSGAMSGTNVGGVVGWYSGGSIADSTWNGSVTFGDSTNAGGIAGYMSSGDLKGTVEYNVTGKNILGGLVGYIENGNITGGKGGATTGTSEAKHVGGLVGYMKAGTISGGTGGTAKTGKNVGGLVGTLDTSSAKITGGTGGSASSSVSQSNVGGLVGHAKGSEISGGTGNSVSGNYNVGGLVGLLSDSAKILSSDNEASSSKDITNGVNVGGLVGEMTSGSEINGGKHSGSISGGSNNGGIVGLISGGTVSGGTGGKVSGGNAGGIAGEMTGGEIKGGTGGTVENGTNAGGIVGKIANAKVTNGTSGMVKKGSYAGGIAGYALKGSVIACSPAKSVSGTYAGGAVGDLDAKDGVVTISSNVYISVTGSSAAGGLIGYTRSGSVYIGSSLTISGSINHSNGTKEAAVVATNTIKIGASSSGSKTITVQGKEFGLSVTNEGTFCYLNVAGTISSSTKTSLGGIADVNNGQINNCSNSATITLTKTGSSKDNPYAVGGIAGTNNETVYRCSNSGVIASGEESKRTDKKALDAFSDTECDYIYTGGMVGYAKGSSYSSGTNSGTIKANVLYKVNSDETVTIVDCRGQVAGYRDDTAEIAHVDSSGNLDCSATNLKHEATKIDTKTIYNLVIQYRYITGKEHVSIPQGGSYDKFEFIEKIYYTELTESQYSKIKDASGSDSDVYDAFEGIVKTKGENLSDVASYEGFDSSWINDYNNCFKSGDFTGLYWYFGLKSGYGDQSYKGSPLFNGTAYGWTLDSHSGSIWTGMDVGDYSYAILMTFEIKKDIYSHSFDFATNELQDCGYYGDKLTNVEYPGEDVKYDEDVACPENEFEKSEKANKVAALQILYNRCQCVKKSFSQSSVSGGTNISAGGGSGSGGGGYITPVPGDIADIGLQFVGVGGQQFWDWYGLTADWCAMFVSYCAEQAGVSTGKYAEGSSTSAPKNASCNGFFNALDGVDIYGPNNKYGNTKDFNSYTPQRNDLMFFLYAGDTIVHHIAIVTGYENGYITTVEGNTGGGNEGYTKSKVNAYSQRATWNSDYKLPNSGHYYIVDMKWSW